MVRPTGELDSTSMIMILRHGEKPLSHSHAARGITPDGEQDANSLTVHGWVRAGALIELFAPSWGEPPVGLRRPDAIYGAAFEGDHSKRAVETVFPLAARLGLQVVRQFGHGHEKKLARHLRGRPGVSLVCWHHDGIHKIVKHLGDVSPAPPKEWPEDRYDMVWVFTREGDRWRFTQVPQLLIPGDLPYVIDAADDVAVDAADDDHDDEEPTEDSPEPAGRAQPAG